MVFEIGVDECNLSDESVRFTQDSGVKASGRLMMQPEILVKLCFEGCSRRDRLLQSRKEEKRSRLLEEKTLLALLSF